MNIRKMQFLSLLQNLNAVLSGTVKPTFNTQSSNTYLESSSTQIPIKNNFSIYVKISETKITKLKLELEIIAQ